VYATSEYSDSDQSTCLLSSQHVGSEMNIVLIPSCYEAPPGMQHRSPDFKGYPISGQVPHMLELKYINLVNWTTSNE